MKIATINNKTFLVAEVTDDKLVGAFVFNTGNSLNVKTFGEYLMAKNSGILTDIFYKNQVFTSRDLTIAEAGMLNVAEGLMAEAEARSAGFLKNLVFSELLGKM